MLRTRGSRLFSDVSFPTEAEGLEPRDFTAIQALAAHRGLQAAVRFCEIHMSDIERQVFAAVPLTHEGYIGLTREHLAYQRLRDLLLNPVVDEEEAEDA